MNFGSRANDTQCMAKRFRVRRGYDGVAGNAGTMADAGTWPCAW